MPRKKKTKEAKPEATPEAIVTVAVPEEASNSPAITFNGATPEPIATVTETAANRVAPETNANKKPEQQGRSNNRSRNKNRNKNKKEVRPDAAPEGMAPAVVPAEDITPSVPNVNSVASETTINLATPETAANREAPEQAVNRDAPETNGSKRQDQPDRPNNRSKNKNRNKNKKDAKPELVTEEIVNFIEEEEGIENPDLVTINMICTNVALLQTILDVQVKILAKLNNQELSQVNAQVDNLYKKHRKKALGDLMKFDKEA